MAKNILMTAPIVTASIICTIITVSTEICVEPAAERMVLAERYWNLYQMALKKGNEDGARKALDSYKSLYNFHDTAQKVDPKKLEASNYILKLPRNANKLITKMLSAGIVDFNSLGAEDVEFKEILENEEEEEDVE